MGLQLALATNIRSTSIVHLTNAEKRTASPSSSPSCVCAFKTIQFNTYFTSRVFVIVATARDTARGVA